MTAATMTITEFLLARIAEDEAAGTGHQGTAYHHWQYVAHRNKIGGYIPGGVADDWHDGAYVPVSEHIARHDPARVLAECEAKREIVRRARRERGRYDQTGGNLGNPIEAVVAWETAVRTLAAVFADHPDHRDDWKP